MIFKEIGSAHEHVGLPEGRSDMKRALSRRSRRNALKWNDIIDISIANIHLGTRGQCSVCLSKGIVHNVALCDDLGRVKPPALPWLLLPLPEMVEILW